MSEYQYYEFLAIDRPLDRAAQAELRRISSRAQISPTRFINHYEWGDFRGDPRKLLEQWFDVHIYLANWGSRRLMMRFPSRLVSEGDLAPFIEDADDVTAWTSGEHLLLDINFGEMEPPDYDDDDGSSWLARLLPLRADVLAGDLRLFYLLWLMNVQYEILEDNALEPMPGMGPVTDALESFANFFQMDPDLVQVAAERGGDTQGDGTALITALSEEQKTAMLMRVFEGDTTVGPELKRRVRSASPVSTERRTAGDLRARASEIAGERERAQTARREAEARRLAQEAETARRARIKKLKSLGDKVWWDIQSDVELRLPASYDRAAAVLNDLRVLAAEEGKDEEFRRRLAELRLEHRNKRRFIERLDKLSLMSDEVSS